MWVYRETQSYGHDLTARGIRLTDNVMDVVNQLRDRFTKSDPKHRYVRTTIPASYRLLASHNYVSIVWSS